MKQPFRLSLEAKALARLTVFVGYVIVAYELHRRLAYDPIGLTLTAVVILFWMIALTVGDYEDKARRQST